MYLGMEEGDIFMYGLTKPIRPRQGIVTGDEVEYGICPEISRCGRSQCLALKRFT
jgi:hypothetical protein